ERAQEAGNDVVGVVAENHRLADDLGTELDQVLAALDPADELVNVGAAGHLARDPQRLDDAVPVTFIAHGQSLALQLDLALVEPTSERALREKDAVRWHGRDSIIIIGPADDVRGRVAPHRRL